MTSEQLYLPLDEIPPSSFLEKYVLNTSEGIVRFAAGKNVVLTVEGGEGSGARERDSSRVHSNTLSEYKWASEEGYNGRLLAVHGSLIAYRLFNDSTGESVRVLEKETRNRHLIKGFMYPTADLQWAPHAPLLAVLDCNANLYVYHVDSNCVVTKYLNVMRSENAVPPDAVPRLSWCPFIPESEEPHELVHMVAIYFNTTVELITLNAIKSELENEEEVTIEKLAEIPESLIRLPEEHICNEVRVVCMSPDATAVAVAMDNSNAKYGCGVVSFFIIGAEGVRFAHKWQPSSPWRIYDLIFLDNIDVNSETPEQFWKYAIVANEEGHRLELYESESWLCIGKLRFESADRLSKFAVTVDPSARFLFLADYDAANVYCIEMVHVAGVPHFAACTQISFCHPLVYVAPYSITSEDVAQGGSLYDDEEITQPGVAAWLIALTQRSLLQLQFDLDTANIDTGAKETADGKLLAIESLNNSGRSREDEAMENISRQLEKESEVVDAVNSKLEKLLLKMEQQAQEAERQRRDDQARIEGLIQELKDEMSLRDERLLLKFGSVISENRSNIVEAIQNSIDMKMDSLTEKLQAYSRDQDNAERKAVNNELMRGVRETMMTVLVPALNTLCSNLFQQLSENFRVGLEQFLRQVRDVQLETARAASSAASTSGTVDGPTLIQLIENEQIPTAFEKALSQKDLTALMFVCNNVDPDSLFRDEQILPQAVVLGILKRLGSKLDGETDLKFRYIENSVMALNVKDPTIAPTYRHILDYLQTALLDFMAKDSNSNYKRQTRIILQLIANLLR